MAYEEDNHLLAVRTATAKARHLRCQPSLRHPRQYALEVAAWRGEALQLIRERTEAPWLTPEYDHQTHLWGLTLPSRERFVHASEARVLADALASLT